MLWISSYQLIIIRELSSLKTLCLFLRTDRRYCLSNLYFTDTHETEEVFTTLPKQSFVYCSVFYVKLLNKLA